jgi:hypothetical protein
MKTMKSDVIHYEYRDRVGEMWLEGSCDKDPNKDEIYENAKQNGFKLKNLVIWYDTLQEFWRFNADLIR